MYLIQKNLGQNSVKEEYVQNVLMDEEHHSTTMKVSVLLNMLYGHVSGNNSEVAIELSIFVSWIATIWGLWTSRKANKSNFLPLILLMFKLTNFNPPRMFIWVMRFDEILSFFSFDRGSNLFWFTRFNRSTKKESEKLKITHFEQIHVQPDFNTFSYSTSVTNEHSLWIHISQPSHWTALWTLENSTTAQVTISLAVCAILILIASFNL